MTRKVLQFTIGLSLVGLMLTACSGPETIAGFQYVLENWIAPELSNMTTLTVATDDSLRPEKTFYLGKTTQSEAKSALRSPDFFAVARSWYSYWDYCYTKNYKISLKPTLQKEKCSALRLFFDDKNLLYDHSQVEISKQQSTSLTPINPSGKTSQVKEKQKTDS